VLPVTVNPKKSQKSDYFLGKNGGRFCVCLLRKSAIFKVAAIICTI